MLNTYKGTLEVIETVKKDVIGVWMITDTIAVQLVEIKYGQIDTALVKYGHKIMECVIQYSNDGDYNYIIVDTKILPFDDCVRFD